MGPVGREPRPPPEIYIIDSKDFRSVVQKLTGCASAEPDVLKPEYPSKLQRTAPPPLEPTLSFPRFTPEDASPFTPRIYGENVNNTPFNGFGPALSRPSQRIISTQLFPDLQASSPNNWSWGDQMLPSSAALLRLAHITAFSGAEEFLNGSSNDGGDAAVALAQNFSPSTSACPPNFSLSHRFEWSSHHPNPPSPDSQSTALALGIGKNFQTGPRHALTGDSTTEFAFPGPDYSLSGSVGHGGSVGYAGSALQLPALGLGPPTSRWTSTAHGT